ncbi:MAG: hypothetical protein GKS07_10980 [Nitrosopumilus sp.]|nr:MAG: hypothetical protein GKS07_00545 [Nitrosopumilus sp.]QMU55365.1 MAG: hypothetical protein GKS07_10980 [Nitrosopumilus sp.]
MTLNNSRVEKIFWMFGHIMPLPQDDAKKKALEGIIGGKLETIVPQFMKLLSLMIKENPEVAEMWFEFFSQSVSYIREDSDEMPEVSIPQEEINRIWTVYDINHKGK